jgi:hypothetical protein
MLISGRAHTQLLKGDRAAQAGTQVTVEDFTPTRRGVLKSKTREQGSLTLALQRAREPEGKSYTITSQRRPNESLPPVTIPETKTPLSPQCTQSCAT